jgi:nucleoside-diphosphate-sugar epimerase
VLRLLTEIRPAIIYHLATHFIAQHQSEHVDRMVDANLKFGVQIADAAASLEACRFINVGTTWQHFRDAAYSPTSLYASMKQAFEDVLRFYASSSRLDITTLVLGDTYGPGDPRPKLLSLFKRYAESGDVLRMTPGLQRLDLTHVDDVVEALVLAPSAAHAEGDTPARYMVRTGVGYTVREIAALYEAVFDVRLNIEWGAIAYHPNVMMDPPTLGNVLPGWHPRYSLEEGLRTLEKPRV